MMACNGEMLPIPSRLKLMKDDESVESARSYYEAREYGHYICLKHPRKCRKTKIKKRK